MIKNLILLIPAKGWLFILGFIIGIPTSIYGVQWLGFKLVKQETNCYSDLYLGLAKNSSYNQHEQIQEINNRMQTYDKCLKDINPNINSINFIKQEVERNQNK